MTKLLLPFLLLFFMLDGLGQITFEKNITGINNETLKPVSIKNSPENGFVIAGNRIQNGISSVFLMKTNEFGDTIWVKDYYSTNASDFFVNQIDTLVNGYILNCSVKDSLAIENIVLIRTDLNGEVFWSHKYNSSSTVFKTKLIKTDDGGFAVCGVEKVNPYAGKLVLVKVNANGNLEWEKKITNAQDDIYNVGISQLNGKYYLLHRTIILILDLNGTIIETKQILVDINNNNYTINIVKLYDNSILIAFQNSEIANYDYYYFMKIDTSGLVIWGKRIAMLIDNLAEKIFQPTNDGGFILETILYECDNSGCEYYNSLFKFDENGSNNWTLKPPNIGDYYIRLQDAVITGQNDYAILFEYDDLYSYPNLIKIDSLGNNSCRTSIVGNYSENVNCSLSATANNFIESSLFTDSIIFIQTSSVNCRILSICNSISNLSINDTTYVSACGSYSLNGETYTSSGDYIQLIPNQAGTFDTFSLVVDIIENSSSMSFVTACTEYRIYQNGCDECGYVSQSGFYPNVYRIQNAAGCDSLISVDLTIIPRVYISIYDTVCPGYVFRNVVYNNSGIYNVIVYNGPLCDTTYILNLTIVNPDLSINNNSNILTAQQSGASYQWIDCNLDAIIPGATNQSFTPTHVGEYAVQITIGNCTETSNCLIVNNVSLEENQLENGFEIFPNPFTSEAKIVFNVPQTNTKIQLLDVLGKELQSVSFSGTEFTIYRESLSASMYFVQIKDASGKVATRKIVLE